MTRPSKAIIVFSKCNSIIVLSSKKLVLVVSMKYIVDSAHLATDQLVAGLICNHLGIGKPIPLQGVLEYSSYSW
jgi:hypothetical protein